MSEYSKANRVGIDKALAYLDSFGEYEPADHPPFAHWTDEDAEAWAVAQVRWLIDSAIADAAGTERTATPLIIAYLISKGWLKLKGPTDD
jgi:hypothetical protein